MDAGVSDPCRTVAYTRDVWNMEKVPWALLSCFVGVVFVVYLDPKPARPGIVMAFVAFGVIAGVLFLGHVLFELVTEGRTTVIRAIALGLILLCVMAIFWNSPGDIFRPSRPGRGPNVPADVFGWMAIIGGAGFIVFALVRHVWPGRPILVLSPAGILYNGPLLKNLFIPWHEIQEVGPAQQPGVPTVRYSDFTAVVISREFYERHMLAKRNVVAGPGWHSMFLPKGDASMQMVLDHRLFGIDPKLIREPVEARWTRFRNDAQSVPSVPKSSSETPVAYGTWSINGSPWQTIKLLVPLAALAALLARVSGVWPG